MPAEDIRDFSRQQSQSNKIEELRIIDEETTAKGGPYEPEDRCLSCSDSLWMYDAKLIKNDVCPKCLAKDSQIKKGGSMNGEREMALEITGEEAQKSLVRIEQFQKVVKQNLKEGHDYGTIPGTNKPTLYKPGAEKLVKLMGCADEYEVISETEDWDKPFFAYKVRCRLISIQSGKTFSTGLGEANSMESKWRWRWVWDNEVPKSLDINSLVVKGKKYRIPNDDIYSQVNTILKICKKRALVDAALSAGRLSDLFTQDLDENIEPAEVKEVIDTVGGTVVKEVKEVKEGPPETIACSLCHSVIMDENVVSFSKSRYGRILCRNCQKISKPLK